MTDLQEELEAERALHRLARDQRDATYREKERLVRGLKDVRALLAIGFNKLAHKAVAELLEGKG